MPPHLYWFSWLLSIVSGMLAPKGWRSLIACLLAFTAGLLIGAVK